MERWKKPFAWAAVTWEVISVIVIGGFLLYTLIIGGSASLGYQQAGEYFVGNHGEYTKVSGTLWEISHTWEVLFWIGIPVSMLGNCLLSYMNGKFFRSERPRSPKSGQ